MKNILTVNYRILGVSPLKELEVCILVHRNLILDSCSLRTLPCLSQCVDVMIAAGETRSSMRHESTSFIYCVTSFICIFGEGVAA